MSITLRDRLLSALSEEYRRYVESGPHSTRKIKALHGWVIKELKATLGDEIQVKG